jgi:hypothetical protein
MRGARQLLLEEGLPTHVLNRWIEAADRELDTTKFRNWLRFRYAWGQTPSPDNVPIPTYNSSQTYAPPYEVVPTATLPPHAGYGGSARGLWAPGPLAYNPPRPRLRYQQFKRRTREEAAVDVEKREVLVREREIVLNTS